MNKDLTFMTKSNCRFCNFADGANLAHDKVLYETERYFAIASVGGFVEGWTLVCTKHHALNLSNDYASDEFKNFVRHVSTSISRHYGRVVGFEHGVLAAKSETGCGTDHAHFHLVPFHGDFLASVQDYDGTRRWQSCSTEKSVREVASSAEYLLATNSPQDLFSSCKISNVKSPVSQFFRRVLATQLGQADQYDYRKYPFLETTLNTVSKLKASHQVLEEELV